MSITGNSVFAAELNWPDYNEKVAGGKAPIIIPLGSMEQHGYHMPMNVDVLLPTEFARRVAVETGALVAPSFLYGYKSHQKSGGGNFFPGTTSLDGMTYCNQLRDVMREFIRHGAEKICLINGHFENTWFVYEAIDLVLREQDFRRDNIKILAASYWDFVDEDSIEKLYPDEFPGWAVEHGGVLETSLMLKLYPESVDMSKAVDHEPASFPPYDVFPNHKEWTPNSGTLSSPVKATPEKGELLLEVCTAGLVDMLRQEFFEP